MEWAKAEHVGAQVGGGGGFQSEAHDPDGDTGVRAELALVIEDRLQGLPGAQDEDDLGVLDARLEADAGGADGVEGGVAPLASGAPHQKHAVPALGGAQEPGLDHGGQDHHALGPGDVFGDGGQLGQCLEPVYGLGGPADQVLGQGPGIALYVGASAEHQGGHAHQGRADAGAAPDQRRGAGIRRHVWGSLCLKFHARLGLHAGAEGMLDLGHLGDQVGGLDQLVLGIAPGDHHVLAAGLGLERRHHVS